jgi:hypothetical protein
MQVTTIKFSKPGKMPCSTFSTPAQACITGSKLREVPGSVCSDCYAMKGNYRFPNVKAPRETNLAAVLGDLPTWRAAMIDSIRANEKSGYFRWHDSGDVQSFDHLLEIINIARALPEIRFWLPTKEKQFLARLRRGLAGNDPRCVVPANLTIRLSMAMIDEAPHGAWPLTSTVHRANSYTPALGHPCGAYQNKGKCGDCRTCWDASVPNVSYPKH